MCYKSSEKFCYHYDRFGKTQKKDHCNRIAMIWMMMITDNCDDDYYSLSPGWHSTGMCCGENERMWASHPHVYSVCICRGNAFHFSCKHFWLTWQANGWNEWMLNWYITLYYVVWVIQMYDIQHLSSMAHLLVQFNKKIWEIPFPAIHQ